MIRVLVVEDHPDLGERIGRYVARTPGFWPVGVAGTGAAAIELARASRLDVVVLALALPDMSGFDVWRELHALPRPPGVIAMTADSEPDTVYRARAYGTRWYLIKPFDFAAFRAMLERYADDARRFSSGLASAGQQGIDRALGSAGDLANRMPKGVDAGSRDLIVGVLRAAGRPLSADQVAAASGLSRSRANRYLDYLREQGIAALTYRYGGIGRPAHLYELAGCWAGPTEPRGCHIDVVRST